MLTPHDFKTDLTEDDFRKLRQEVRAEQVRKMRAVEFTVAKNADPQLVPGETIWFEVPRDLIRGRYVVVTAAHNPKGVRYTLVSGDPGRRRLGEKMVRIDRL